MKIEVLQFLKLFSRIEGLWFPVGSYRRTAVHAASGANCLVTDSLSTQAVNTAVSDRRRAGPALLPCYRAVYTGPLYNRRSLETASSLGLVRLEGLCLRVEPFLQEAQC